MQEVLQSDIIQWLSLLNYLFALFILFFERKGSASRFAWILTLILLPIIGSILYIIFSGHFFTKTRKMEEAKTYTLSEIADIIKKQHDFFEQKAGTLPNPVVNEFASLIDMNLRYASSPITFASSEHFFLWGKDKFKSLFEDIKKAQHHIFVQYFIIRNDKIGNDFMNLLCKKAQEGVEVKLLYDDLGCIRASRRFFRRLDAAGGVSLPFFPVRRGNLFSINFRNHRKLVVIDNKIAYTGGFNVGDEYEGKKGYLWRDTHVRLTGSCVYEFLSLFLVDWYAVSFGKRTQLRLLKANKLPFPDISAMNRRILNALKNDIPGDTHIPIQVVSSGPDNRQRTEIRDAMIRMIMNAKEKVYIQTPYFTPDDSFYSALKIAALSGIDVRIMVPGRWDKFYVRAAAFNFMKDLIPLGIQFFKYPGFIHSKVIIIDGKVLTIGSCNIDSRSFDLHFETNIFFYDETFSQKYEQIFLDDQNVCELHELSWFETRPIFQRAWWSFCRLFSPIL